MIEAVILGIALVALVLALASLYLGARDKRNADGAMLMLAGRLESLEQKPATYVPRIEELYAQDEMMLDLLEGLGIAFKEMREDVDLNMDATYDLIIDVQSLQAIRLPQPGEPLAKTTKAKKRK